MTKQKKQPLAGLRSSLHILARGQTLFADMKTKIEIAEELGVSRFKVARLIDEAIEQDYVRFIFPKQQAMDEEIANNLRKNFIWKMQLFFQLQNPGRRKKNSITNWVKSPLNILCNLFMKV